MADRIGIGKTPAGQALQMLVVQAFQQVIPRTGILIKPNSLKDIMAVLEA